MRQLQFIWKKKLEIEITTKENLCKELVILTKSFPTKNVMKTKSSMVCSSSNGLVGTTSFVSNSYAR